MSNRTTTAARGGNPRKSVRDHLTDGTFMPTRHWLWLTPEQQRAYTNANGGKAGADAVLALLDVEASGDEIENLRQAWEQSVVAWQTTGAELMSTPPDEFDAKLAEVTELQQAMFDAHSAYDEARSGEVAA